MPELSRFYGIIITMYASDHNPPHFHAEYSGQEALFNIIDGVFVKGNLPTKEARLVLAWYELHRDELIQNWENLSSGKPHAKIQPLN
ncbi:MAG: DUF4160 domain-containing protein [Oscillospiraceae bacterium]|jgi:hypothetical protein|nr:DUF4160 domain-containing protein [Oscillospiraceae bacterium]